MVLGAVRLEIIYLILDRHNVEILIINIISMVITKRKGIYTVTPGVPGTGTGAGAAAIVCLMEWLVSPVGWLRDGLHVTRNSEDRGAEDFVFREQPGDSGKAEEQTSGLKRKIQFLEGEEANRLIRSWSPFRMGIKRSSLKASQLSGLSKLD